VDAAQRGSVVRPRADGFCAALWADSRPVFDAIVVHPFVTGLTDGSLPHAAFRYYVVQDAIYLHGYARALGAVAARADEAGDIATFATHAAEAIAVERELHGDLLADLGLDLAAVDVADAGPTTVAYVDHLLARTAFGSYADGVAAVLPCYWIYAEVGRRLVGAGSPDPRYGRWIATYGGDEFAEVVQAVLDVTDRLGESLTAEQRARAATGYRISSRYEWMFWDAAWRKELWPIG
jgi:thiaminase (transcriptional activator TenA)